MTKILSARDLLELIRQQDGDERPTDHVTEVQGNRIIYVGVPRGRPVVRAPVQDRLPMATVPIDLAFGPTPLPLPGRTYEIDDDGDRVFESKKTLEMRSPFAPGSPISIGLPPASSPVSSIPNTEPAPRSQLPVPPSAPVPPKAPTPPTAPVPPKAPTPPKAPEPPKAPTPPKAPDLPKAPPLPKAPEPPKAPSLPKAPELPKAPPLPKAEPARQPEALRQPEAMRGRHNTEQLPRPDPRREMEATQPLMARVEPTPPMRPSEPPKRRTSSGSWAAVRAVPREEEPMPPVANPTLLDMQLPPEFLSGAAMPANPEEPVALSGDETLVLLNYDRELTVDAVAAKTGLTPFLVTIILEDLHGRGMIEDVAPDALPFSRPQARQPTVEMPTLEELADDADLAVAVEVERRAERSRTTDRQAAAERNERIDKADSRDLERTSPELKFDTRDLAKSLDDEDIEDDDGDEDDEANAADSQPGERTNVDGAAPASSRDGNAPDSAPEPEEAAPAEEDEASPDAVNTASNYQRHYEVVLSVLLSDQRAQIAATGAGIDLFALTFDKEPPVARALWENPSIAMEHARFAAFHHRTAFGLDRMADRGEFQRDIQVQRRLIRNPMIGEPLLRRVLMPKRLVEIYKVTLDRDVPERSRSAARGVLRTKFSTAEPEDRVQLIWNTEGRVLINLSGLTIDSKSSAIICGRPIVSLMLVQNFCRFGATPPSIIHHCLKQPMIRRQAHLRNALLKHPNCPSEAKRAY